MKRNVTEESPHSAYGGIIEEKLPLPPEASKTPSREPKRTIFYSCQPQRMLLDHGPGRKRSLGRQGRGFSEMGRVARLNELFHCIRYSSQRRDLLRERLQLLGMEGE